MQNGDLHDVDKGYFKDYPAPLYEAMTRHACCEINATAPHYGPMLYTIVKAITAGNALEIGVASGWSSSFISHAIRENNSRFNTNGRFYGIDCGDKSELQKKHDQMGLPSTFITDEKGSVHYLRQQKLWFPEFFQLIFIDGLHVNKYLEAEIDLCYPLLMGAGKGYMVIHDVCAFVQDAWEVTIKNPKYQWEHISFMHNYGLGILRKMDGYDKKKVWWPGGDQIELATAGGFCKSNGEPIDE